MNRHSRFNAFQLPYTNHPCMSIHFLLFLGHNIGLPCQQTCSSHEIEGDFDTANQQVFSLCNFFSKGGQNKMFTANIEPFKNCLWIGKTERAYLQLISILFGFSRFPKTVHIWTERVIVLVFDLTSGYSARLMVYSNLSVWYTNYIKVGGRRSP